MTIQITPEFSSIVPYSKGHTPSKNATTISPQLVEWI